MCERVRQTHFVQQVAAILAETGVPAHCIDIEITEGTVINNIDKIIETLHQLRSLGVKISIDDFGTGYSSLTYLKRLPIDMVKIDQSFVKDIPGDDDASAIINSIISMASHLNLDIIAEGIESIEQVHYLEDNNCTKFQGFFFHRPMPGSDFSLLLADSREQNLSEAPCVLRLRHNWAYWKQNQVPSPLEIRSIRFCYPRSSAAGVHLQQTRGQDVRKSAYMDVLAAVRQVDTCRAAPADLQ